MNYCNEDWTSYSKVNGVSGNQYYAYVKEIVSFELDVDYHLWGIKPIVFSLPVLGLSTLQSKPCCKRFIGITVSNIIVVLVVYYNFSTM